jgi:hypothetical protein
VGINQFSIYASFEANMRFFRKLKCYKTKIYSIFEKLQNGKDGMTKAFFYDSVRMPSLGNHKGCLLTNTYNEFSIRRSNHQRANERIHE